MNPKMGPKPPPGYHGSESQEYGSRSKPFPSSTSTWNRSIRLAVSEGASDAGVSSTMLEIRRRQEKSRSYNISDDWQQINSLPCPTESENLTAGGPTRADENQEGNNQLRSSSNDSSTVGVNHSRPPPRPSAKSSSSVLKPTVKSRTPRLRYGRGLVLVKDPSTPIFKPGMIFRNRKKASSLESSHSETAADTSDNTAPVPVVSRSAQDEERQCRVCLAPPNLRLIGEKPDIVHESCFTAVSGPSPNRNPLHELKLGVCVVCRRLGNVIDEDRGNSNNPELLALGEPIPEMDTPITRNDDDPLDGKSTQHGAYAVAPSIQIRSEFSSVTRTNDTNQHLTCVVVIELPGPRVVPGPVIPENYVKPDKVPSHRNSDGFDQSFQNQRQPSDTQYDSTSSGHQATHDYGANTLIHFEEDSPFHATTEHLRNHITDWRGHPLSSLGLLQMYDLLSIRRFSAVHEFHVYLFKEAIICVGEKQHRKGVSSHTTPSKGLLRLEEIIYVRRIKNVTASLVEGEMSLTIAMEDELATFILIFKHHASLESWKNNIQALVNMYRAQKSLLRPQEPERPPDLETPSGNHMLSTTTSHTTLSTFYTCLSAGSSRTGSLMSRQNKSTPLEEAPHTSSGPSNSLAPLPHPQMDLILVISVPPPNSLPSTAQLKIGVIKATLGFLVNSLGPKDRLSMVTFEMGMGGNVRRTPFLMAGRPNSRARLEKFIDTTGVRFDERNDEYLVRGSKGKKTDVVTAVNHGLDVALQREGRNPVSGMMLISDASDSIPRAQIDWVLTRAKAANIAIHSFGYGRSHDLASLCLMSAHTSGTYTFIKDWCDLQDCVAGCVGGMMSIGLLNMRLHLKIVGRYRFKIRKVLGGPQSIPSADGQNVDVDVGELRYGEKKEMLLELELDNNDQEKIGQHRVLRNQAMNYSLGLDTLAINFDDGPDLMDGIIGGTINGVSVLEVDASFFNPATAKDISRLAHPVLLTINLLLGSQNPHAVSDPVVVRRRMELLASDMITEALILVSRRDFPQAQKILGEAKRILNNVLQTISRSLLPRTYGPAIVKTLQAILQDLQVLSEALEDNVESFVHDQMNFGAQQAMILRDQKSWSGRSATERLFWKADHSTELVSRGAGWPSTPH